MLTPILVWLCGLWLMGWAALPASRRLLCALPDGGLAAGRVLFIAFASLLAFWLASFHLAPLRVVPLLFLTFGCASLALLMAPQERREFLDFLSRNWRGLWASDAIFVAAFLVFGWIRWRNPALNTFEKPMDAALMAAAWRTDWLPLENPWLCKTPFTGYYIFGPMMAANLARCLGGAPAIAYNLAQPAFCALFVSTLYSLCAALLGSTRRGLAAMALVALLGNFQPLLQIAAQKNLWPIDGWATSRVIPNTINEYPFFTLVVGDMHAHFFALALEATLACLCWNLVARKQPKFDRTLLLLFMACGALLAILAMTNPWNAPLDSLLVLLCAFLALRSEKPARLLWLLMPFAIAALLLWPHLRVFRPAISGAAFELWLPPVAPFLLMWGGWFALALVAAWHWRKQEYGRKRPYSSRTLFCLAMLLCGAIALAAPCGVTVLGAFQNTPNRHGDTVFKFGLQAWLLGGIAAACGAIAAWKSWRTTAKLGGLLFPIVPVLGTLGVAWQWSTRDAPREIDRTVTLSLDGARHLPADDRAAIFWLARNARSGEAVLEATGPGSYSEFSRVSALSGVPTVLGWPQHVAGWGGDAQEIARRQSLVPAAYNTTSSASARAALEPLKSLGVRWIFVGEVEQRNFSANALVALRGAGAIAFQSGVTVVLRVD